MLAHHEGASTVQRRGPNDPEVPAGALDQQTTDLPLLAEGTSERLPCEPFDVPVSNPAIAIPVTDEPRWLVRRLAGFAPRTGRDVGDRNKLTSLQRLGAIAALMIVVAVTSMVLLNIGQTLSVLAREHKVATSR